MFNNFMLSRRIREIYVCVYMYIVLLVILAINGSASIVNYAACLQVLCGQGNEGRIGAFLHPNIDACEMQPVGL